MRNQELRTLARARFQGRWGILFAAVMIWFLPVAALTGFSVWSKAKWLTPIGGVIGGLLSFGVGKIALEQLEGGPKKLRRMVFWARRDLIWRALALAALLWVVLAGTNWATGSLIALGREISQSARSVELTAIGSLSYFPVEDYARYRQGLLISSAATLLSTIVSVALQTLFFPLYYASALLPGAGLSGQVKGGLSLGIKRFWRILAYRIGLYLPMLGVMIAAGFLYVLLPALGLLASILFIGFCCWYYPFLFMAEAALAGELFFPGKWGGAGGGRAR